jgi:hypothetical protein
MDTPGHADFGGEVERIMKMVDGVLLIPRSFSNAFESIARSCKLTWLSRVSDCLSISSTNHDLSEKYSCKLQRLQNQHHGYTWTRRFWWRSRTFSNAFESIARSCKLTWLSRVSDCLSISSTSVVLPWSTWAITNTLNDFLL